MRRPRTPPDSRLILGQMVAKTPDRFQAILKAVHSPLSGGKYLHWDKLVRHPAPEGLSHEEWWCGIKMYRQTLFKTVPLHDKRGEPFNYLQVDPIPERLHDIDQGAGGLIQMPDQITNPETRDRYYVGSLIEEAITSSQLEGASTTRPVAKEMLRTGRQPRDRSERMILNNFLTMQRIADLKKEPLTKTLVLEIHRLITEDTLDEASAAGRFRNEDELIQVVPANVAGGDEVFHIPPPAGQLQERMEAMCEFANGKIPKGFIHPAVRSIILHFWLAYDHPFVDGNGRTARALFYWSMLRHGFWLFEFVSISHILRKAPAEYSRAFLYTETDENDLTYFILHQLRVIHRAIGELHKYIKRNTEQLQVVEGMLRGHSLLNHRQRALMSHAIRHPHCQYTIESHRRSHNVVYQTARSDLLDLRDRGLLEARKVGRIWFFIPVSNLEKELASLS